MERHATLDFSLTHIKFLLFRKVRSFEYSNIKTRTIACSDVFPKGRIHVKLNYAQLKQRHQLPHATIHFQEKSRKVNLTENFYIIILRIVTSSSFLFSVLNFLLSTKFFLLLVQYCNNGKNESDSLPKARWIFHYPA